MDRQNTKILIAQSAGVLSAQLLLKIFNNKVRKSIQEDKVESFKTGDKLHKSGAIKDLNRVCTVPFTLTCDIQKTLRFGTIQKSEKLTMRIETALKNRKVAGLDNVTFQDVVDAILEKGSTRIQVLGGFIRDLFHGNENEDIDFLYKSSQGNMVAYLQNICKANGWQHDLKKDERTGDERLDFISIGDPKEKGKFSGHVVGSGCEGEFSCNSLVYDIYHKCLIDPTGTGVADATDLVLRIPIEDKEEWIS